MNRPRIGLTSNWGKLTYYAPSISVSAWYLEGVARAGGFPVMLSAAMKGLTIDTMLDTCDGIIIIGGPDLNPRSWSGEQHPMTQCMESPRQEFDIELIQKTVKRNKPILGICLGIQELNIALGGSLLQDIPSLFVSSTLRHRKKTGCSFQEHTVHVEPSSLLYSIVGSEEIIVNSSHHQAVGEVAPNLRAVAWAPDGVIEAIEATDGRHILGVQWHPEYLIDRPEHLNLFRWLVDTACSQRQI